MSERSDAVGTLHGREYDVHIRTILLGLVTSVVNLKRQEIHLNSARRSTVPDTEKGTPCTAAGPHSLSAPHMLPSVGTASSAAACSPPPFAQVIYIA